ncbi:MAG: PRC-barrel domain-containing protein [Actinomycetota bacterium]|nr:PRC-barrel domain-containing protein [Actinomycetota bacterium]
MSNAEDHSAWRGKKVVDTDGDKIGDIEEVYLDDRDEPAWAAVNTGLFGNSLSLVPLAGADLRDHDRVTVGYDKRTVKDAPRLDSPRELDAEEEAELHRYYGLDRARDADERSSVGSGEGSGGTGRLRSVVGRAARDVSEAAREEWRHRRERRDDSTQHAHADTPPRDRREAPPHERERPAAGQSASSGGPREGAREEASERSTREGPPSEERLARERRERGEPRAPEGRASEQRGVPEPGVGDPRGAHEGHEPDGVGDRDRDATPSGRQGPVGSSGPPPDDRQSRELHGPTTAAATGTSSGEGSRTAQQTADGEGAPASEAPRRRVRRHVTTEYLSETGEVERRETQTEEDHPDPRER